jgi:phosphoenolpyruvate carboxylase
MALFDRTIFTTLPRVARTAGENVRFRWATWVGGDRDGNPAVTAAVTLEAARIANEHVLRGYESATRRIARSMSASDLDVPASPAVRRALARDARTFPERARELERTLADAPHRRRLVLMAERLRATREEGSGGYRSAAEYPADVDAVRASLRAGGADALADGELANLARQAETFGFHLASIEVRQHAEVIGRALLEPDAELDATLRAMADIQSWLGEEACHRLILTFTRGPEDVAAAYTLATSKPPAPTVRRRLPVRDGRELARATEILDAAIGLPAVRAACEDPIAWRSCSATGLREGGGRARGLARSTTRSERRRLGRTDRHRAHRTHGRARSGEAAAPRRVRSGPNLRDLWTAASR